MKKEDVRLIRKRIIPDEEVLLDGDEVLFYDEKENIIVTKWVPIKKRNDFFSGFSEYHLNENYKISSFCDEKGKVLYLYADIIKYFMRDNTFVVVDLLIDVKRTPDNKVVILDKDELVEAKDNNLISKEDYGLAIKVTENVVGLLSNIDYFPKYINKYIQC